jgi:hypothetical protein
MLPSVAINRSARYRRKAADCFAMSQHLTDPALKATMLLMAQSWSALADYTEPNGDLGRGDVAPPEAEDHV